MLRNEIPTNSSVFKTLATIRLVYKFTTVCMSIGCDLHVDLSSLYGMQLHHFLMPLQFCITTRVPCSVRSLMFQSLCSLLLRRWSVLNSKGIMFSIHCRVSLQYDTVLNTLQMKGFIKTPYIRPYNGMTHVQ